MSALLDDNDGLFVPLRLFNTFGASSSARDVNHVSSLTLPPCVLVLFNSDS